MELLATFSAANPKGLTYWPYYDTLRFVDAGDVCALENSGDVSRKPVAAVKVVPRLGGGALVLRPTDVALSKLDNLDDLDAFAVPTLGDAVLVAGGCDPDGTFYAADDAGRLHMVEPTSRRTREALSGLGVVRALEWSQDTETAFLVQDDRAWAYAYDPISGFESPSLVADEPVIGVLPTETGVWLLSETDSCLRHYAASQVTAIEEVPHGRPTSMASDGESIFILSVDQDGESAIWILKSPAVPPRFFGG